MNNINCHMCKRFDPSVKYYSCCKVNLCSSCGSNYPGRAIAFFKENSLSQTLNKIFD
jgi:hypothetical protein